MLWLNLSHSIYDGAEVVDIISAYAQINVAVLHCSFIYMRKRQVTYSVVCFVDRVEWAEIFYY